MGGVPCRHQNGRWHPRRRDGRATAARQLLGSGAERRQGRGGVYDVGGRVVSEEACGGGSDALLFAQWRLAVLARHRANAYDGRGEAALAMEETRIADALDKKNAALARIRDTMAWASRRRLERMTPYEGLRLGLARTDFAFARSFALKVLDISPDDQTANFALGMDFFVQRQYSRAQAYLERCLDRRPNETRPSSTTSHRAA